MTGFLRPTLVGLVAVVVMNCNNSVNAQFVAYPGSPAVSPSGRFVLKVFETEISGSDHVYFEVSERDTQKLVLRSKNRYRTRDAIYILWGREDRVWLYSGDVGTFWWTRQPSGVWKRHIYRYDVPPTDNIEAPEFLKEVRPQLHKH